MFHSVTLLYDYEGNVIWLGEKIHSSNIEYADIDISDEHGLIISYYGELVWVHPVNFTTMSHAIKINKLNRGKQTLEYGGLPPVILY